MNTKTIDLNFIRVGDTELSPKNIKKMRNSIKKINSMVLIKERLDKEGYLFFRGSIYSLLNLIFKTILYK